VNPDFLEVLAKFVPLGQTLLWVGLTAGVLWGFRGQIGAISTALRDRAASGAEVETPWLSLRGAPKAVRGDKPAVATAEGVGGADGPEDIITMLRDKAYPQGIEESVYLIHAADTVRPRRPDQPGLWRVRVWLEAYDERQLGEINRVSYRLYEEEFLRPVITTTNAEKEFELWLSVYGEFTVVAYVEREGRSPVWLTRYLDLPGRPPE
jgi:hypothetical protein